MCDSSDQICLKKPKTETKALGLVFEKGDRQFEIHQARLFNQILGQLFSTLLEVAVMNRVFILTEKRHNLSENMVTPRLFLMLEQTTVVQGTIWGIVIGP